MLTKEAAKVVARMTRKEIEAIPERKDWTEHTLCTSLVIIPLRRKHDSGYRMMDFLAVGFGDLPICRVSGISDVLHIDGIGGYGDPPNHSFVAPKGWSIDCLPVSGLLRLFGPRQMICTEALSSFNVFGEGK